MKNKNKRQRTILILTVACVIVGFFVFCVQNNNKIVFADTATDDTQDKLKELEKKAEVYRQIIEVKQKQKLMLSDQINSFDSQIQKTEAEIAQNKRKIEEMNSQIVDLGRRIDQHEKTMASQRKMLADLMESYYAYSRQDTVATFLSNNNSVASFMVGKDRISQTGDKVQDMLDSVKEIKQRLENERKEIENKKLAVTDLHVDLEEKTSDLEASKNQKQTLLSQTKGEESKYQQLLARVEQQKLELLDLDQLYASGFSIDDFPKPSKSAQSGVDWYYSQRDSRWGNVMIGSSNSSMKSWGCAVTSVAMVFKKHGANVTPKTLARASIFSGDLINWPSSWSGVDLKLASSISHGNVNWSRIDSEIKKNNPVIVYIKKMSGGGHYVVIHHKDSNGKYVVHDPYFGPNLYLDTSRALVGGGSGTKIDQMIIYN